MSVKHVGIDDFIKKQLARPSSDAQDTSCAVIRISSAIKPIYAIKLGFYLLILGKTGNCAITVGHHDFSIQPSSIAIVPPHTVLSIRNFSEDFDAQFLLFKPDFIKKGFVKSDIMDDLLFIHPDYPPLFDLQESTFEATGYKLAKIKEELENQSPFCLEICRLYILQILYDYNRVCEICLLNSDKLINRQYQIMYEFRKLVDKNFQNLKTVHAYAELMFLSSKYVSECVKNQTGLSALTLIQNRIMLEAELLLKYSHLSIKSISEKLGFPSTSAFSRFFKGIKGLSPIHYLQKQEN